MNAELVIPKISEEQFDALSPEDQVTYIRLYKEQVAPCFEPWRNPSRVKCAYGGRGAGAKSRSAGSLLIQFGENPSYFGNNVRVLCVRHVQKSIKESSWLLLKDQVERLGYEGWKITDEYIRNEKNGSYYVFAGLNNISAEQLKSYESFDILFVEEGAPIPREAWLTILATFRKKGSEIWCLFNRTAARDPCYELFCDHPEKDWTITPCRPGPQDNPWWYETTLQKEWDRLKADDPDDALHVYEGFPRVQGDKAVFPLSRVMAMRDREIDDSGAIEIGGDIARFGRDFSVGYKRKGLRVIECKKIRGADTNEVAGMFWDLAGRDPTVPIKLDSGYNPGVIDVLAQYGANVVAVGFGEKAKNEDKYSNAAAEMMFELPIDEISIPAELLTSTLTEDLSERTYGYDAKGRRRLESKDGNSTSEDGTSRKNFKGRHGGRSPDEGDALCLCFYEVGVGGCY